MAIEHLAPGASADLRPLGPRLKDTVSTALFKSPELEVMRLVLRAGQTIPQHAAPGEMTILCLEGELEVRLRDAVHPLQAGHLMRLLRGATYELHAVEDCSLLVTIAMPPD
ncbi:MAG TPA: cupin [Paucimonas sp.]|nr:cupin [Paucimonas sp.]